MSHSVLSAALVAVGVLANSGAPQQNTIRIGEETLPMISSATRSKLFGFIDLYEVTLFAPPGAAGIRALQNPQTPKALRIDIKYDGELPDSIPAGWKSELQPALNAVQQEALHKAYARLRPSDVITITYSPGVGTDVVVSGKTVLDDAGHDVIAAFLDIWLGQTPVSEDMKDELLNRD